MTNKLEMIEFLLIGGQYKTYVVTKLIGYGMTQRI